MKTLAVRSVIRLLFVTVVSGLISCNSIRLISEYDEIADQKANELQEKVSRELIVLQRTAGTPEAAYEKHISFYDDVYVDLNTLQIRAQAMSKNQIITEMIKQLKTNVNNMEAIHKIGFRTPETVEPLKITFNSDFLNIIQFLSALKRGEKS